MTRELKRKKYIASNTNREYATVIEAISAGGDMLEPYIILSAKSMLQGWIDTNSEKKSIIDVADTGYMNDQIAWRYIQHFHRRTKYKTRGQYRLLLCDGYGSHMTYEFLQFCGK